MSTAADSLSLDEILEDLSLTASFASCDTLLEYWPKGKPRSKKKKEGASLTPPTGDIDAVKRWLKVLTTKTRRNWQRAKNYYARAHERGIGREGAPLGKSGSPIRVVTAFGIPFLPGLNLLKTRRMRVLAKEVDKMWAKKGTEITFNPEDGENEFYVHKKGRLTLADEVEALSKAFNIRPFKIKEKDSEGNVTSRYANEYEMLARIKREGKLATLTGPESAINVAILIAAVLALVGVGVYPSGLGSSIMSFLKSISVTKFL